MPQLPYPSQIQGGNMPGLQFYLSSYSKRTVLLKRLLLACLFSLCLSAFPLNARTIVVGSPPDSNAGNCYPLGCAYKGEYQQVYTHTLFQGPIIITALEFFNTQDN